MLCSKCFNTTYHYSLWVLALPVLSLCPTLLLSSPPLILRPLKGAAPHLLVPRHLKSSGAVERTPTSSLCLWFHLSTSHEAKHGGVSKWALPERKAKKKKKTFPSNSGAVPFLPLDGVLSAQNNKSDTAAERKEASRLTLGVVLKDIWKNKNTKHKNR